METRKADEGYGKRRIFDLKSVAILLVAIIGPTGIVGLMNYQTDPNIQLEMKVGALSDEVEIHHDKIQACEATMERREMRVENYIKSQSEKDDLRNQLIDQKLERFDEILNEIRSDVKDIKNDN